jgi:hypothetical protein
MDRVDALLRLRRIDDADRAAQDVLTTAGADDEHYAYLADLFAGAGLRDRAADLFEQALALPGLSNQDRQGLYVRQGRWFTGAARWRLLLQGAELLPPDDHRHASLVSLVVREMTSSVDGAVARELAAAFAVHESASAAAIVVQLLIRQAELTPDPAEAADVALDLHTTGRLPADRFDWTIQTIAKGKRFDEVVAILEERLRNGERLTVTLQAQLEIAYSSLGQTDNARRATTDDSEEPFRSRPKAPNRNQVPPGGGFF